MIKLPHRGWLFDLDGTIYLGEQLVPGADRVVQALRADGRRVAFLSNKPLYTRADYAAKLTRLGIETSPDEVVNSSLVLARHLATMDPGAPVFVIGEPPLIGELEAHGFEVRRDHRDRWVVIAFDRTFDYAKLNTALQAVRQGARLIATNPDRTCPTEDGEIPDCAGMIAAAPPRPPSQARATEPGEQDPPADDPDSGAELVGRPAPAWSFTRWIGSPRTLAGLRGKVVLLRWWTEGCHFCATTLPELEALRRAHADDGLVVIGVFHPKPPREVSDRKIAALAKRLGFSGPIAVDREWRTLERYWLADHPERNWTSVSFLVDREGRIRWVHGGGEYHPSRDPAHARCAEQYRELERALAEALAERAPRPTLP